MFVHKLLAVLMDLLQLSHLHLVFCINAYCDDV